MRRILKPVRTLTPKETTAERTQKASRSVSDSLEVEEKIVKSGTRISGTLEVVPDGGGGAILRLLDDKHGIIVAVHVPSKERRGSVQHWNSVCFGHGVWPAIERVIKGQEKA